jgi:hypothetical protein
MTDFVDGRIFAGASWTPHASPKTSYRFVSAGAPALASASRAHIDVADALGGDIRGSRRGAHHLRDPTDSGSGAAMWYPSFDVHT